MPKLSFTTMATPDQTGAEAVKLAKKYGFQGVDIRVGATKSELMMDSSSPEINELRSVFEGEGIIPSSLLCYVQSKNDDSSALTEMREGVFRCIDIACKLGSNNIRIWLPGLKRAKDPQERRKKLCDLTAYILETDKSNVNIVVQNHRKHATALEVVSILQTVNHPRFGLVFSPEHCIGENEDIDTVFQAVKPWIKQLYIADIKATESGHIDVLPGKGNVPLKKAYELAGGKEFDGWITFKWEKIWRDELDGPETALPYFINWCRKALY